VILVRKAIAIIVAVLFVFALTSVSFAAEGKKAEGAMSVEKPKVKMVTGEVKAVDTTAGTVTVVKKLKGKEIETVVTVDSKTKIMMGKEKKALADVMAGDKVKVKYTEVDGKNVAKSIAIKAAEKKAEEAKPAEKPAKKKK
jgi:Cu/Ag efflux protein CusF